ncbi:arylesterase [Aureimonas populi]|uniref:Arylesterase n=1 Tax=Aureimonas populi TaxID=1701758 RepID=A0ABW5CMY6_9HYPH|nr:arylesterase [Aureimonas populi]
MQRFQPLCSSLLAFVTALVLLAAPAAAVAQERLEVVAFGDSLVAGYGVGPGEAFPEQLQAALRARGYDVDVINAGVSGDTTSAGLARLDWSVPESADLVIVELGANDALRGVSPQVMRQNLDEILARLTARPGTEVLLAGMVAPPNMGGDYGRNFNPVYEELARKHDVPLYPFFLDGVASIVELNQNDYMHPNARGIEVIVERILPMVTRSLDAIRASRGG